MRPARRLKTVLARRGHTVAVITTAFRRMVRTLDFDVCELAMTTYMCARAHGKPFTAVPVFPMRALHHGAILQSVAAGIAGPKDLEGRTVGINRGYTVTTGLWARAVLQHEYDVDLNRVTWMRSGDEHVAEYQPPSNVVSIEPGRTLQDLLELGEIAAAIGIDVRSRAVRPLIPDPERAALTALRQRGIYPINHTIVIRNDVLEACPDIAADLFAVFAEAKAAYVRQLRDRTIASPSPADALLQRVMDITGDPLPYGIATNRRTLEAVVQYAIEQKILRESVAVDELFVPSTRGLIG
jgi:4,5-dihydroxyphthalate decarboxylase